MEFESCLKRDSVNEIIELFQVFGITSLNGQFRGYEYTIIGLVDDQFYWSTAKGARRIIAKALFDANIKLAESRVLIDQSEKELSN